MLRKSVIFSFLIIIFFGAIYIHLRLSERSVLLSPKVTGTTLGVNLWFPQAQAFFNEKSAPAVTAQAAYFIDLGSGEVLYQKNIYQRLPIASLVKIMTAIVTLENHSFSDEILISSKAAGMEPDKMLLQAGESMTVEEIMYGIFMVSANDGSQALCEGSAVDCETFIDNMNKKAAQLGMRDTLFINPSGLQEDGKQQYSTAFDVALMSRYLISYFPHILDISSTPHILIPKTQRHQDYEMYSGINLLTTYPGVKGLKTGYTPEAGMTLVSYAERDGKKVLGVLLDSKSRRDEAKALLDYSFKKLGVEDAKE